MPRPTVAEIDLVALTNNWTLLTEVQPVSLLTPVIKANAYGHGVVPVAQQLQKHGAQRVAVALLEEALELRQAGFSLPILVLGPFATSDIPEAQRQRLTPMVGDPQFLENLGTAGFSGAIHLKWDTGMNRLGLVQKEIGWVRQTLQRYPSLRPTALSTHLLRGDDVGLADGYSESQIQNFLRIADHFPEITEKHVFNSDGFFANHLRKRWPFSLGSRPGLSLYGYCSVDSDQAKKLQPVMTLKTKIVHLNQVAKGGVVSYNATWTAQRESVIAVLPLGYADGYPRVLSNKGQVFVRGQVVPLVGIVCMDYLMIDVTDVKDVALGDEVELWGKNVPLEPLARAAGTITYELMTALTSRVPRKVL